MKFVLATVAVLAVATPALAENWHSYSRTDSRAYLADVDSIATTGSTTSIRAASVPLGRAATDLSHGEEVFEFDCAGGKWRTAGAKEFAEDGTVDGEYPEEGAAWEPLRRNTVPDFLKQIACDGSRATGTTYPTIRAFIEAGRP